MTGKGAAENTFLAPLLARYQAAPQTRFGVFHDGEEWEDVTFGVFFERCLRFSSLLLGAGVAPGQVVLALLGHGQDAQALFIGAMLIGAIPGFLPLPSVKQHAPLYWRQHRAVVAHINPAAIVTEPDFQADMQAGLGDGSTRVLNVADGRRQTPFQPRSLPPDDAVALLQHSSGTTGLKKGVQLSHAAICLQLSAYGDALELGKVAAPCFVSWLPLYHDMGLISSFLLPLWRGIPVISIDPFEWTARPALFFEAIEKFQGTHAWVPNFALAHQLRTAPKTRQRDLRSLQALIGCSEPCKPDVFAAFARHFADWGIRPATLQTCYAMAENVFAVTQSEIGVPPRRIEADRDAVHARAVVEPGARPEDCVVYLSNGKPIAGCEVAILQNGDFVGPRRIGEICIHSPFLFGGYFNNETTTQTAFAGKWFKTGDLGFLDEGELFVAGRVKEVIIVNGKNIFAHDVEASVSGIDGIKPGRVVALGAYAAKLGTEQLIVVAERSGSANAAPDLAGAINRVVVEEVGAACADVRVVDEGWLIKTTSGKMSRSENLAKYQAAFAQ